MTRLIGLVVALCLSLSGVRSEDKQAAQLAEEICQHPNHNVAGLSDIPTVLKVIEHFEYGLQNSACRKKYLSSVRFLQVVLTVGNENACGEDKISLLEDFNARYVSTTSRDKENRKRDDLEAPEAIKVFFMHYGYQLSRVCKDSLVSSLARVPSLFTDKDGKPANVEPIDKVLERFAEIFGLKPAKNGYKDLILPWKMIDSFLVEGMAKKFIQGVRVDDGTSRSRIPVRISIRVNGAGVLKTVQKSCIENMRPAYSKLALPVLHLINLGFYKDDEPLAAQLSADKNLLRFFGVAQFCETILPIEAFQDDSLEQGKLVAISMKKAAELRADQATTQAYKSYLQSDLSEEVPEHLSVEGLAVVESLIDPQVEKRLTKIIKSNRAEYEKLFHRLVKLASGLVKSVVLHDKSGKSLITLADPKSGELVTQVEVDAETEVERVRNKRDLLSFLAAHITLTVIASLIFIPMILYVASIVIVISIYILAWPFVWAFGSKQTYDRYYR